MAARLVGSARRWLSLGLLAVGFVLPVSAGAAPVDALSARLVCPPRPGPGRVVCEVELEVDTGTLTWADVLVIEAPSFAAPLRSRVGQTALFMKTEQRQRLQLALAATRAGSGRLRVRARAVACADASRRACQPLFREVEAPVQVGPITE
ncbi:MAG TPA: hypothetical protein VMG12_06645 [Polyangiaceae bacterium]|nr:hypothetical protein [Polyangiaceae bacterium]